MSKIKKECPKCGRVFPFDNMFCSIDGTKLKEVNTYKYFNVKYNLKTGGIENIDSVSEEYRYNEPNYIDINKITDIDEFIEELETLKIDKISLCVFYTNSLVILIQFLSSAANFYIYDIEKIDEIKLLKLINNFSKYQDFSVNYLSEAIKKSRIIIEKYDKLPESFKLILECDD